MSDIINTAIGVLVALFLKDAYDTYVQEHWKKSLHKAEKNVKELKEVLLDTKELDRQKEERDKRNDQTNTGNTQESNT